MSEEQEYEVKRFFKRQFQVLHNRQGEFYVDKVIGMIIAVVVGGVLLAGLIALFNTTVLPGLADKIQGVLN